MRISILSNINIDMLTRKLSKFHDIYSPKGYGNWVQSILNKDSGLVEFNPEALFILLDGHQLLNPYDKDFFSIKKDIDMYVSYIETFIKNNQEINTFISNIDLPLLKIDNIKSLRIERKIEEYWYDSLSNLVVGYDNLYVFEMKSLIEKIGRDNFYSKKMWYLGSIVYSIGGQKALEKEILRYTKAVEGKRKKCLILDLDNTLWGGVIGEEGIDNIELSEFKEGARYKDFQKRIKELKETGVILAIVSKNNHEDAIEVFSSHEHMVLKEDDFVNIKINWDTKIKNINDLSEELNIGLDSFVFIDDNPVERESVKMALPQVEVPNFPEDTSELEKLITELYYDYFLSIKATDEDKKKSQMYRANIKRKEELKGSGSFDEFLKSLKTKIKIWKAKEVDIDRIAQLTQKTNQFNLTTKRYTNHDIRNFINSEEYDVYVAAVEDKFGDNGKTVVLIIKKHYKEKTVEIDTFLMSCRVMGRFIENTIINFIENNYRDKGYEKLMCYYYPTKKNKPVSKLFERYGYTIKSIDNGGAKQYIIELERTKSTKKEYGELIINEG
ncbi:HAD-IIIC family phosphatase [Dethiothermospora halolimnae]|uniref:HAD-IIIC family phosphatase n=1 Tax=Dethiothermospora halolimnae TaxID=3114390 RepID=UPI003CCC0DBC